MTLDVPHHLHGGAKIDAGNGVVGIHLGGLGPESSRIVESEVDGVDDAVFFRGHKLDDKTVRHLESL